MSFFHPDPGLWGGAELQSPSSSLLKHSCTSSGPGPVQDAGVQRERPVLHLEEHTSEGQTFTSPPGQGMWRGHGEAWKCIARNLVQETEGSQEKARWHLAIYLREAGRLSSRGTGHQDPSHRPSALPTPGPCPQGPGLHPPMLFSAVDTRGRAATCRNPSKGSSDPEKRMLSGTPARLGGWPTMCHTRPHLDSSKAVSNLHS